MPEALEAMEVIKSCGGNLEVAVETALRGWLESTGALARHNGDFDAAIATEKARKKLNKENAVRRWLPIILEKDKDISLNELIYQLRNAVGLIDREAALNLLRETDIEAYNSRTT